MTVASDREDGLADPLILGDIPVQRGSAPTAVCGWCARTVLPGATAVPKVIVTF